MIPSSENELPPSLCPPQQSRILTTTWIIALAAFCGAYLYQLFQVAPYTDSFVLYSMAERFWQSGTTHWSFDTNPPLSYIAYLPALAIHKILHIPAYLAQYTYVGLWHLYGLAASLYIIRKTPLINAYETLGFITVFLFSTIVMNDVFYTVKEQPIIFAVLPFVLMQLRITNTRKSPSATETLILVIGSIFLLIKPHLGLLPAAILLHRMITQKRFWTMFKDRDLQILIVSTSTYILALALFFHEFVTQQFPIILQYYLPYHNWHDLFANGQYALIAMIIGGLILNEIKIAPQHKALPFWLFTLSFLSFLSVLAQGKGLLGHMIPMNLLCALAWFFLLKHATQKYIAHPFACALISALCVCTVMYANKTHITRYTHQQYQQSDIVRYIQQNSCETCGIYIHGIYYSLPYEVAQYSERSYASRLPALFSLGYLLEDIERKEAMGGEASPNLDQQIEEHKSWLANLILEDLEYFNADLIFVSQWGDDQPDYVRELLSFHKLVQHAAPTQKKILDQFQKTDSITLDYKYFTGNDIYNPSEITFDIYKRTSPTQNEIK